MDSPFKLERTFTVKIHCKHTTFGLELSTNKLFQHVWIWEVAHSRTCCILTIASTRKPVVNHVKGAYIVAINNDAIFSEANAVRGPTIRQGYQV